LAAGVAAPFIAVTGYFLFKEKKDYGGAIALLVFWQFKVHF
jgi:hypothetical protein